MLKILKTSDSNKTISCLDNAPTEFFFGYVKDKLNYLPLNHINNYIFYHNNDRTQWNRKKGFLFNTEIIF